MVNPIIRRLAALILFGLFIVACQGPAEDTPPPSAPSPTETSITSTPADALTATPLPQASPTPSSRQVLLVAPESADPGLTMELQAVLEELATAGQLRFQTVPSISADQLTADIALVVAIPPDPGLNELAASDTGIQFLGVNIPGLQATANLSAIGPDGARPDQLGFLAGYIAAVVTPEWRVGALTVSDSEAGRAARDGFLNGVVFFCGLCQQIYPPYNKYPLYAELPGSASSAEWQSAAETLIEQAVGTVYIAPGAEQEALVNYLVTAGVNVIGNYPPPPGSQERWVASIGVDYPAALRAAWPELIAGQAVGQLAVQPVISSPNPEIFSPGRQLAVQEILPDLQEGYIDTGINQVEPEAAGP